MDLPAAPRSLRLGLAAAAPAVALPAAPCSVRLGMLAAEYSRGLRRCPRHSPGLGAGQRPGWAPTHPGAVGTSSGNPRGC